MNTNITTKCNAIAECIHAGIKAWTEAGKLIVELLDDNTTLDALVAQIADPMISREVLSRFERIGRGQVLPELLVAPYPAAKRMQRLPLSEQKRCMGATVEMLVIRDGEPDTLAVHARELTPDQCKQVFSSGSVRTLGEQRLWLEQNAKVPAKLGDVPYTIRHHKVHFRAGAELDRRQLAILLTQLD